MPRDKKEGKSGYDPVDVHVGKRLRFRRKQLGLSQEKLGKLIGERAEELGEKTDKGITFQQIGKYESGQNRTGASRIWQFGKILGVPEQYFFEGLEGQKSAAGFAEDGAHYQAESHDENLASNRETLELMKAYHRIPAGKVRKSVHALLKTLAKNESIKNDDEET